MTNKIKIIIGILVISAIIIAIVGVTGSIRKDDKEKKKDELTQMYEYFNQTDSSSDNEIENNTVGSKDETENSNNTVENNNQNKNNTVIGKEERDSKQASQNLANYEQKAIDMAKEEWGISVDSFDFDVIEKLSDTIYKVRVTEQNGSKKTVATYTVDVEKGTVKE